MIFTSSFINFFFLSVNDVQGRSEFSHGDFPIELTMDSQAEEQRLIDAGRKEVEIREVHFVNPHGMG